MPVVSKMPYVHDDVQSMAANIRHEDGSRPSSAPPVAYTAAADYHFHSPSLQARKEQTQASMKAQARDLLDDYALVFQMSLEQMEQFVWMIDNNLCDPFSLSRMLESLRLPRRDQPSTPDSAATVEQDETLQVITTSSGVQAPCDQHVSNQVSWPETTMSNTRHAEKRDEATTTSPADSLQQAAPPPPPAPRRTIDLMQQCGHMLESNTPASLLQSPVRMLGHHLMSPDPGRPAAAPLQPAIRCRAWFRVIKLLVSDLLAFGLASHTIKYIVPSV